MGSFILAPNAQHQRPGANRRSAWNQSVIAGFAECKGSVLFSRAFDFSWPSPVREVRCSLAHECPMLTHRCRVKMGNLVLIQRAPFRIPLNAAIFSLNALGGLLTLV